MKKHQIQELVINELRKVYGRAIISDTLATSFGIVIIPHYTETISLRLYYEDCEFYSITLCRGSTDMLERLIKALTEIETKLKIEKTEKEELK